MKKVGLILAVTAVLSTLCIEISVSIISLVTHGKFFSKEIIVQNLRKNSDKDILGMQKEDTFLKDPYILHPYVGFVADYDADPKKYNPYGFEGDNPVQKKDPNTLIVGVFGGSVAAGLYNSAFPRLIENIKQLPQYKNHSVTYVSIALGGYKQPQQLLALTYLLSLGAEFDVIINFDGFNEVALPYNDNFPYQVSYFYPRYWNFYSQKGINTQQALTIADIMALQKNDDTVTSLVEYRFVNWSYILLSLLNYMHSGISEGMYEKNIKLNQLLSADIPTFQTRGPFPEQLGDVDNTYYDKLAEVWYNGSIQMHKIAQENDIQYFHFLQPNQYFPGSKPLSAWEMDNVYFRGDYPYKTAVENGYPILRRYGERLTQQGVNFSDLSMIFSDTSKTTYIDYCCHYNSDGYSIIVAAIIQALNSQPSQR